MSETLNAAISSARRTASNSVTLLKGLARNENTPPMAAPSAEFAPLPMTPAQIPSVISAQTQMTGSINTTEELHVQGTIDGDVRAAKIVVCAGGSVKGTLVAETIVVHGAVEGRMDAQHVRLCGNAVAKGEITHSTLGIETTAVFEGSIKRMPAQEPAVTAAE